MKMSYEPPFKITAKSVNLVSQISADLERYAIRMEQPDSIRLRKINRMKTIRGSLAIEGNTLSEEQVTALIDGKHIIAPAKEIQEARNAIRAYDEFMNFNPYDKKDLLRAHGIMAYALVDNPGHFRKGGVCVAGKDGISHISPPADRVDFLMSDLFDWVKNAEDHILIKSSVFHYEFEFIHPFIDGNGRMGRYWQTMLLSRWKGLFAWLPVETIVKEHQQEYYSVIQKSDQVGESTSFVEFMLRCLFEAMDNYEFWECNKEAYLGKQKRLIDNSKHLFVSAEKLKNKFVDMYNLDDSFCTVIRNGYDKSTFANYEKVDTNFKHPCVTYIGTIDDWFDFNVITDYAKKHPNVTFNIIGPINPNVQETINNINMENIIFHGPIEHSLVPRYIEESDVMMMPFLINELIEFVDPVKLYEYLYMKKPVVSSYWGELKQFNNLVYFYKSPKEFEKVLNKALSTPFEVNNNYKKLMKESSWESRLEEYLKILEK